MAEKHPLLIVDQIEPMILDIRGQKVLLLDNDLADLYGVPIRVLNQAVKRNRDRFPDDFLFQLTSEEEVLRSQSVTLKRGRGEHRKYLPYAFTEHGAIMAASILNSPRAVEVSVFVVRAFVKLRHLVLTHKALAAKLDELERKVPTTTMLSASWSRPSASSWHRPPRTRRNGVSVLAVIRIRTRMPPEVADRRLIS